MLNRQCKWDSNNERKEWSEICWCSVLQTLQKKIMKRNEKLLIVVELQ